MAYSVAFPGHLHVLRQSGAVAKPGSGASKPASLAALWAKNYVTSLANRDEAEQLKRTSELAEIASAEGRLRTANFLKQNLTQASAKAWSLTNELLADEIWRHGINPQVINPWQIAADSHHLFEIALNAYGERVTPRRLSVLVNNEFGRVRQKYTAEDPRAIGVVSMQFHYTGELLLDYLCPSEHLLLQHYFKVMDDHLYMPLKAAYEAAASYDYDSPLLQAVRELLPNSTRIAQEVCKRISQQYPGYQSYSGSLSSLKVRISSIRDVEMFQVYLCLCVLENSIQSVQKELFPLCVMLYPRLKVSWKLVQEMLHAIGWEMHDLLSPDTVAAFLPYLSEVTEMFSIEAFQE
ncbi:MAG TPA: hypothetical protein V6C64_02535 [Microcoleaceae cyanobacterium]|jgi:hypothetical protein